MAKLPPLNALRAFEAAARHNGYIGASMELHVTRGAISRHVKLLENHLGVQLFTRRAQGVRLTAAGRRFLPVLTEAFSMIAQEAERVTIDASDLRIICPPATSVRWLLPRLEDFRSRHPDIRIRLTTEFHSELGFDPIEYDIGISVENWPNKSTDLEILPLFPIHLTPACAPAYIEKYPLQSPEALSTCELLHETTTRTDWRDWITAFAPRGIDRASAQYFPNLDMAVKAAVMGAGVVMADLILCRDELESGTLITPFPKMTCESPLGAVCLVGTRKTWDAPNVQAFRTWAFQAAASDRKKLIG